MKQLGPLGTQKLIPSLYPYSGTLRTGGKVAQEQKRWAGDSPIWDSLWRPNLVPTMIQAQG